MALSSSHSGVSCVYENGVSQSAGEIQREADSRACGAPVTHTEWNANRVAVCGSKWVQYIEPQCNTPTEPHASPPGGFRSAFNRGSMDPLLRRPKFTREWSEGFQRATLATHRVGVHERHSLQRLVAIRRVAKHLRRNLSQLCVVRQVRARHDHLRPLPRVGARVGGSIFTFVQGPSERWLSRRRWASRWSCRN